MNEFNQLRQNVRNYCVGLTCEEIEKEIEQRKYNPIYNDTVFYFQEYLDELKAEQVDWENHHEI